MLIADQLRRMGQAMPLFKGSVLVIFVFRFPITKNFGKARRYLLHNAPRNARPDIDNLEKFICDAMNRLIWEDDSQICMKLSFKVYTNENEGSTSLVVKELDPCSIDLSSILETLKKEVPFYAPIPINGTDVDLRDNEDVGDDRSDSE